MTFEFYTTLCLSLATIAVWFPARWAAERLRLPPLDNPLVVAGGVLCAALALTRFSPERYLEAVWPVTAGVPIATVALALPLYRQARVIWANARAMLMAALAATSVAVSVAVGLGWALGLAPDLLASVAPKSTTMAVALPLSQLTGGIDALAVLGVTFNGVGGVLISEWLWRRCARPTDLDARSFALGVSSHAIGVAATMRLTPRAVSLASCGMLIAGVVMTALYALALVILG